MNDMSNRLNRYSWGRQLNTWDAIASHIFDARGLSDGHADNAVIWTTEISAAFTMRIPLVASAVEMQLGVDPYLIPDRLSEHVLDVFVNGLYLTTKRVDRLSTYRLRVDRDYFTRKGTVRLGLRIPTAMSPKRLGTGEDLRDLGVMLKLVAMDPVKDAETEQE